MCLTTKLLLIFVKLHLTISWTLQNISWCTWLHPSPHFFGLFLLSSEHRCLWTVLLRNMCVPYMHSNSTHNQRFEFIRLLLKKHLVVKRLNHVNMYNTIRRTFKKKNIYIYIYIYIVHTVAENKTVSKSVSLAHGCRKGATRSKVVHLLGTWWE